MKTTGALWNAYLASWPEDQWFDDSDESVDGKPLDGADAPEDAEVEVTCGVVYANRDDDEGKDLIRHFQAWKRAQDMQILVVEVPKAQADALRAAVKQMKGKVRE